MRLVLDIIAALLLVFAGLVVIRVALSWLHPASGGLLFRTQRMLTVVTEPYLRVFRRSIPISRIGLSPAHDFSVFIALLLLYVVALVLLIV